MQLAALLSSYRNPQPHRLGLNLLQFVIRGYIEPQVAGTAVSISPFMVLFCGVLLGHARALVVVSMAALAFEAAVGAGRLRGEVGALVGVGARLSLGPGGEAGSGVSTILLRPPARTRGGCNPPSLQCQRAAATIAPQIPNRYEKSGLAIASATASKARQPRCKVGAYSLTR